MDRENDDDILAFNIKYALEQYRYKPPPRLDKDPNARQMYYRRVADVVRDQLKVSWKFERKSDERGMKR